MPTNTLSAYSTAGVWAAWSEIAGCSSAGCTGKQGLADLGRRNCRAFPPDEINSMLEALFREFDKGNYDKAVNSLFDKLIDWYENYYDFDINSTNTVNNPIFHARNPRL